MIQRLQKIKLVNNIIKKYYLKGIIPEVKNILDIISTKYQNKKFGEPFFTPNLALFGSTRKAEDIKSNFVEIQEDFEILNESILELDTTYRDITNLSYNKYLSKKQKLIELTEKLNYLTNKESSSFIGSFYDVFRNTSKINLSKTKGIYVDTKLGNATLSPSLEGIYKLNTENITVVNETKPDNFKLISGSILSGFNLIENQYYQILLDNNTYSFELNLTSKEIIKGSGNEVYLNKINIDPISSYNLKIEYSTDRLNWNTLVSTDVLGYNSFDFEPVWTLFLRFSFTGRGSIGYRSIELFNVDTGSYGELFSNQFLSTYPIYQLDFSYDQNTPYGTSIEHFISTSPENGWTKITKGSFFFGPDTYNKLIIDSSGFVVDNTNNPSSLYCYSVTGNPTAIYSTGELFRGYGQVKVDCFGFDYSSFSDPNHIPRIEDWINPPGVVSSCYMSPSGTTSTVSFPTTGTSSFIFNYTNSTQTYWGVSCQARHSSGGTNVSLLTDKHSYKLTTYLYSDRDILINNFGGGIYIKDPTNPTTPPSNVSNSLTIGWSMYINSERVASDNKYYSPATIPGSGSMTSDDGYTFPVNLKQGWNKIELLTYVPDSTYLDSRLKNGWNIMLLFRPNIFNFSLSSSDSFSYAPAATEYPIWADGITLKKVSEFYLENIVKPWDFSSWAWRVSSTSGTVASFLLNYNPMYSTDSKTIDGRYKGSPTKFLLKYNYNNTNFNSFYYKAVFSRTSQSTHSPKLTGYKFTVLK